ncbi:hypothetical protein V6N11_023654 [Hibiscus sabdariffa]|uniref:TF-B3 domain-containing protein n=1 Tax=Hibiscus sabdariffa TaxID=183260 RepID=A0ABR2TMV0_9ROSI
MLARLANRRQNMGKMQPITSTGKQKAADIACRSSLRLVNRKIKEKSNFPYPVPRKTLRTESLDQHRQNSKLEVLSTGISPDESKCRNNLGNLRKVEISPGQLNELKLSSFVLRFFTSWQYIPEDFAKRYLKNSGEIILRAPDGRTWTVEHEIIKTTDEHGRAAFCRRGAFRGWSWRPFVIGNELKALS